ncbi:WD repeat and HMG-box DNA-binding protein 1-like [Lineus longissimus]|uniref:WD repeat and HMG-box DNA-binding protein 1-like n=1 Tax=Lineus longissimus TaxID=88925 RepID=UPI002B4F57BC
MPLVKQPLRFAHSEGHTDLCYDDCGRYMLTSGAEGDVRVWQGIDDDDAVSHRAGEKVYAIAFRNNRFYTASDTNTVHAHTFPEGNPDGVVTRFTAPVNHMVLNKTGTKLAAGASDFTVKLVDVKNNEQKVMRGHEAPILSIALDPKEKYLASSSCDGTVRIWNIDTQSCVKSINAIPKCNDFSLSKTLCRIEWHPDDGKCIAVPLDKEIRIYERDTWDNMRYYTDVTVKEPISIATFSPCGKFLAAACRDGAMFVWNFETKTRVISERHDKSLPICALKWNPKGNHELAYCDTEGQLGVLENVVSVEQEDEQEDAMSAAQYASLFADDDDDNDMIAASNMGNAPDIGVDDDDDDDNSLEKLKKRIMGIDDENSKDIDSMSKVTDNDLDSMLGDIPRPAPQIIQAGYKPTPLQRPFQSSSTPVQLSQRFMVWNSVGIIRQYSTEEENSIDIEFHDTATHHAMHVTNDLGHTMADMSSEAVVLACEADDGSPSKLVCLHFSSWDNSREWAIEMPKGEEIQATALGEGWVAVATDKRNVRIITIGGIQRHLFSTPGPIVTITASGSQLGVVYHMCHGLPGDQCLWVKWISVNGRRQGLTDGCLPLSPKSTLSWIGFSLEGTPFLMDSSGIVRMLNRKFGPSWIPVASTKDHVKGKSDGVWIVGILEHPQQLRCIPCKGSSYPPVLPRPALTILPFQIPVCETSTEKGQFEEGYIRSQVFSQHLEFGLEAGYDEHRKGAVTVAERECLMKLFALACKTDREFRAVEICKMMPDPHTVQLAIKYASRLNLMSLAEKLNDVVRMKHEEEMARALGTPYQDEDENYRPGVETGYSHPTPEWSRPERQQSQELFSQEEAMEAEEEDTSISRPTILLKTKKDRLEEEEIEEGPKSLLSQSQGRKNPFKVGKKEVTPVSSRGTSVFDSLTKSKKTGPKTAFGRCPELAPAKMKKPTNVKKISQQAKLFSPKENTAPEPESPVEITSNGTTAENKTVSAFQLWYDSSRSELEEEHPDVSEEDLAKLAAQAFRQVPKEERKEWMEKAKTMNASGEEGDCKKRKRDEDQENVNNNTEDGAIEEKQDIVQAKKKPAMSGKSKLAGFAFSK